MPAPLTTRILTAPVDSASIGLWVVPPECRPDMPLIPEGTTLCFAIQRSRTKRPKGILVWDARHTVELRPWDKLKGTLVVPSCAALCVADPLMGSDSEGEPPMWGELGPTGLFYLVARDGSYPMAVTEQDGTFHSLWLDLSC